MRGWNFRVSKVPADDVRASRALGSRSRRWRGISREEGGGEGERFMGLSVCKGRQDGKQEFVDEKA